MKATCLQENIQKALQIAARVTPARTTMPITQNTLVRAEGRSLEMVATNLEMTVRQRLPAEVEREGEIAIPNKLLAEFISALPRDPVEIEQRPDTMTARLTCGRAKANIHGASADLFPPTPEIRDEAMLRMTVEEFRKAVSRVAFCAASESGRPSLTGILVEVKDGTLVTAGADGFRLSVQRTRVEEELTRGEAKVVVPARVMSEVQRIANNNGTVVDISIPPEGKYIRFRVGDEEEQDSDIEIISVLLVESYPDYESLIPTEMENKAIFNTKELQNAVRRAAIFARGDNDRVMFDIRRENGEDMAVIYSESKDLGNNRAELRLKDRSGKEIEIAFNGKYIQEMLGGISSETVRLETNNRTEPAKIGIPDEEDYVHVIMPVVTLGNQ